MGVELIDGTISVGCAQILCQIREARIKVCHVGRLEILSRGGLLEGRWGAVDRRYIEEEEVTRAGLVKLWRPLTNYRNDHSV